METSVEVWNVRLAKLSDEQLKYLEIEYLKRLAKSIDLDPKPSIREFVLQTRYGLDGPRGLWRDRKARWYEKGSLALVPGETKGIEVVDSQKSRNISHRVPLFSAYFNSIYNKALSIESKEQPKMKNEIKDTTNRVVDTNKEAFKIAAKLTAGKGANEFFLSKLMSRFPWYVKLFGKKREIQENPFAKLATAEVASALVQHFAPENKKLTYVSDAMVQDAMLDLSYNSDAVKNLLNELDKAIKLPEHFNTGE